MIHRQQPELLRHKTALLCRETETGRSKGKGPASGRPPPIITADGELPLRHDGRRRWRLAFAVVLGIGSGAEESKHRGR